MLPDCSRACLAVGGWGGAECIQAAYVEGHSRGRKAMPVMRQTGTDSVQTFWRVIRKRRRTCSPALICCSAAGSR